MECRDGLSPGYHSGIIMLRIQNTAAPPRRIHMHVTHACSYAKKGCAPVKKVSAHLKKNCAPTKKVCAQLKDKFSHVFRPGIQLSKVRLRWHDGNRCSSAEATHQPRHSCRGYHRLINNSRGFSPFAVVSLNETTRCSPWTRFHPRRLSRAGTSPLSGC